MCGARGPGALGATEFLLRKYRGFVEVKARSYFLTGAEQEDVVQEGMIGLYKAIRDYRDGRQAHFRSFAELVRDAGRSYLPSSPPPAHKHAPLSDYRVAAEGIGEEGEGCLADLLLMSAASIPNEILLEREIGRMPGR